ncbi:unnamed protein product [Acanthosepion pharaonis]|uniref:Uncharacterized protein n=1 Tax=Acanthosepion pharaonis TaxID=158019 RepID=A0A812B8P7_ACAPH|nr:unnamed protein product [Sepia pharaonis]
MHWRQYMTSNGRCPSSITHVIHPPPLSLSLSLSLSLFSYIPFSVSSFKVYYILPFIFSTKPPFPQPVKPHFPSLTPRSSTFRPSLPSIDQRSITLPPADVLLSREYVLITGKRCRQPPVGLQNRSLPKNKDETCFSNLSESIMFTDCSKILWRSFTASSSTH